MLKVEGKIQLQATRYKQKAERQIQKTAASYTLQAAS
jgi:hypothetical protein